MILFEESARIVHEIEPDLEIILVNDGSLKNFTKPDFHSLPVKIISYSINQGKGFALRKGVESASGKYVVYTDVDFPYTENSFSQLYHSLQAGKDVAIGIRNNEYYRHLPKSRVYVSKFLRSLIQTFLHIPTDDTQCGLKGFNQRGRSVFLQTKINRYLFDLEFVFLAAQQKLKIQTVEVQLKPGVTLSRMNWRILIQELGNFFKIFVQKFR